MIFETYNNIGLSLMTFLSVIKHQKTFEYSKALLILPLLLHNPLVAHIKDKRRNVNGIEDLIISKVEFFLDFNDRFYAFLPLSINTILIAERLGYIRIDSETIVINTQSIERIDFSSKQLGHRCLNIIRAAEKISKILNEKTNQLYFKLRIEI